MKRAVIATAAICAYAWWAAGVSPFSALSYALVGIPSLTLIALYSWMGGLSPHRSEVTEYYQGRADGASLSTVAPWLVILVAVAILESVGLALGGRATDAPTLSTTVDHLLAARWERFLLLVWWLLAGAIPLTRLRRIRAREGT